MVSQGSPPNPNSSMLHQFIISNSVTNQAQFEENQHFMGYASNLRPHHNTIPHQSLGGLPSIQSLGERISRSIDLVQPQVISEEAEISRTRHFMDLFGAPNETHHQAQGLSLSLDSHVLVPSSVPYKPRSFNYLVSEDEPRDIYDYSCSGNNTYASSSSSLNRFCSTSHGTESFASTIGNSRYLKPAQSLLEEVVSVCGKDIDISNEKYASAKVFRGGKLGVSSEINSELFSNGHLSAEKHELQIRIAKLISLLDEVDGRYEKYYHQMEEVVSSFEAIAGIGSAKSYTALALQAMSRHFGSLRDLIVTQINLTKRKISQDLPKISAGFSQLSLFDRETNRQSRISLQQLGLMQSQRQAWRPIRGLPETSVAILRSWLFEHFLNPYPNDSEKLMLASQTGLTKNQVSNWFINARVRLWKPMIEEMYKEEFADSSEDSNPLMGSTDQAED